ncbi:bifunctional precorrin-2 dehydrogenase/sirohydrochlorin ferrochelatase [archaeon]|nr:bifunctional precorrin-2 dehydrogenase/sirohydrochlorin ferrochelatase [archaeon]
MIVDLNLHSKKIIIVGGGKEAQKRVRSLLKQECSITIITDSINQDISKLAKSEKIKIIKQRVADTKFISRLKPNLIITTTDDRKMNQKIINAAKKKGITAYSSDNPEDSDFSNPAIIDFENMVQVAIFTGGRSPIMSKKIKEKLEKILKKIITNEDLGQIKVQKMARKWSKEMIPTQDQRKEYLRTITNDSEIDQLIKDGQVKKAEKRASTILKNWK